MYLLYRDAMYNLSRLIMCATQHTVLIAKARDGGAGNIIMEGIRCLKKKAGKIFKLAFELRRFLCCVGIVSSALVFCMF